MKLFLAKIVSLMKEENLFASQGGPIILAQVILFTLIKFYLFVLPGLYPCVVWCGMFC